jgi:hypothetical protein
VKGSFVIDPSIYIPITHRPPLQKRETEEGRKNLRLESHHGSVEADILLVDDRSEEGSSSSVKRITVQLSTHHGSIFAKVVRDDHVILFLVVVLRKHRMRLIVVDLFISRQTAITATSRSVYLAHSAVSSRSLQTTALSYSLNSSHSI